MNSFEFFMIKAVLCSLFITTIAATYFFYLQFACSNVELLFCVDILWWVAKLFEIALRQRTPGASNNELCSFRNPVLSRFYRAFYWNFAFELWVKIIFFCILELFCMKKFVVATETCSVSEWKTLKFQWSNAKKWSLGGSVFYVCDENIFRMTIPCASTNPKIHTFLHASMQHCMPK